MCVAVREMESALIDTDLGGQLHKKRVSFSWRDAPPTKDETRLGFFLGLQAIVRSGIPKSSDTGKRGASGPQVAQLVIKPCCRAVSWLSTATAVAGRAS
jgi:hypothetical protein